jgi:hypothetical protein
MSKNPFIDEFTKARIKQMCSKIALEDDKKLLETLAEDFGRLIAHSERKHKIAIPAAFEMARNHFINYGMAMVKFGEVISIEGMRIGEQLAKVACAGCGKLALVCGHGYCNECGCDGNNRPAS